MPKDAVLLGVLPAEGLECSPGGVHKESTNDNAAGHAVDRRSVLSNVTKCTYKFYY